jgi:uncharacterized protein YaiE (UPF0345 family)
MSSCKKERKKERKKNVSWGCELQGRKIEAWKNMSTGERFQVFDHQSLHK